MNAKQSSVPLVLVRSVKMEKPRSARTYSVLFICSGHVVVARHLPITKGAFSRTISSALQSPLFPRQHYSRRGVMEQVVPVAARFLHQGNKGLVRSVSSYLSLVAIGNAALLARNVTPILDSCTSGVCVVCAFVCVCVCVRVCVSLRCVRSCACVL